MHVHDEVILISIHAPRVRGDEPVKDEEPKPQISIHAPRVRGDRVRPPASTTRQFQSTPLV